MNNVIRAIEYRYTHVRKYRILKSEVRSTGICDRTLNRARNKSLILRTQNYLYVFAQLNTHGISQLEHFIGSIDTIKCMYV